MLNFLNRRLQPPYTIIRGNAGGRGFPADDGDDFICEKQNKNGSILVANGDKRISNQLAAILDKIGYDVVVSSNGEQALDLFLRRPFDIVFTALKMPGMDGLTLSLQVKGMSLNMPVVLILDENIENVMSRIKVGRIDFILFKPLKSGSIQQTVKNIMM
jgi:two-component system response regulator SaeR